MIGRNKAARGLGALPGLADLGKKDLAALARAGKEVAHGAGATIISQGAGKGALHLILEGTARVDVDGAPVVELGPGEFFGELAFMSGAARSASVVAVSQLRLHSVTAWGVPALFEQAPGLEAFLRAKATARGTANPEEAGPAGG